LESEKKVKFNEYQPFYEQVLGHITPVQKYCFLPDGYIRTQTGGIQPGLSGKWSGHIHGLHTRPMRWIILYTIE
jgi:hypothetical protein